MARNDKTQTVEKPAEATPVEATEATAVEPTEGATEPTTEAPATEAKPEAVEPDLTALNEALKAALDARDKDNGALPDAQVEAVVAAYRALDAKGKRLAKKALQDGLRDSVNNNDMGSARAYMGLNDKMVDGAASKATREPVDPTEAFVERAVALKFAAAEFTQVVPEGVKDDWRDRANKLTEDIKPQIEAYRKYLAAVAAAKDGETVAEPEGIHDAVRAAFKVASGKGVGGLKKVSKGAGGTRAAFDGPRRDIAKHITAAFDGLETGAFLTVAEIRTKKSDEYGDEQPSSGAISARLFPQSGKVTVEGVRPGEQNGKKGAFKL